MIGRSFPHRSDRARAVPFLAQGRSLSPPHPWFVSGRLKTNMATQSVLASACFEAMTEAAIAVQALNTDRMVAAVADRGLIAGVQRP
jgi:hypothetical protein